MSDRIRRHGAIFFCCVAVVLWLIHFTSGKACLRLRPGLVVMLRWLLVPHLLREDMPVGDMACCTEAWRRWRLGRMRRRCSTASSTVLLGVALGASFWIGVALVVGGTLVNVWLGKPPPVCPFLVNRTS